MSREDHEDVAGRRMPPVPSLRRALDALNPAIRQESTCRQHRNDATAPELLGQLSAYVDLLLAGIDPHDDWSRQDVTLGYVAVAAGREGREDEEVRDRRTATAHTHRLGMIASLLGAGQMAKVPKPQALTLAGDIAEVATILGDDGLRPPAPGAKERAALLADRLEALAAQVRAIGEEEERAAGAQQRADDPVG